LTTDKKYSYNHIIQFFDSLAFGPSMA